ncbi:MAG: invasion associated locus B family protein [Devosia sp.]
MKSMQRGLVSAVIAGGLLCGASGAEAATKPAPAAKPAAAAAPAAPASAMAPTSIGTFKSWTAWTGKDTSGLTCYISAEPTASLPAGLNRDPVHFLIVDRKGLGTKNEVQTLIGYTFKKDSKPASSIDSKTYPMIADGSGAWLAAAADEPGFVAALKKGTKLTVKGTSQRGTETTDTYTLSGVTAAIAAIEKACS